VAIGAAVVVSAWLTPVLAQSTTPATAAPPPATIPATADALPAAPASAVDAYAAFRREFDAGRYVEAVTEAQRVLALAEEQATTPVAEDVQVALMNLGMAQNLAEDFLGAETTYKRAIKLIEDSGRPLHARLARAHAGLATAYHDSKRHELAVRSFDQAIALTRRHEGLLTDRQVPLIEKYIDSLTELGRYQDALQAQRYLLRVETRKHGESSIELTPRLEKIARWYTSVGAYDQARRLLKQTLEVIETAEGENSQRLVSPLLALAACNRKQMLDPATYESAGADDRTNRFNDPTAPLVPSGYSAGMMAAEGERSLLRAAAITEAAPSPSPAQVVNVRTQLGDWYQVRQQSVRALPHYRAAWKAAEQIPARHEGKPYTEAIFGQPVLLHVVRPEGWDRNATKPPDTIEVRTTVVEATVEADGRATGAKVIDDSGDARRGERSVRALTDTGRYRPRFENGEPVATEGVRFEQLWILTLPDREPEAAPTPAPATPAQPATEPPATPRTAG
jgi:tetratricopeptide (TPR) repeat protein